MLDLNVCQIDLQVKIRRLLFMISKRDVNCSVNVTKSNLRFIFGTAHLVKKGNIYLTLALLTDLFTLCKLLPVS